MESRTFKLLRENIQVFVSIALPLEVLRSQEQSSLFGFYFTKQNLNNPIDTPPYLVKKKGLMKPLQG